MDDERLIEKSLAVFGQSSKLHYMLIDNDFIKQKNEKGIQKILGVFSISICCYFFRQENLWKKANTIKL